MLPMLLKSFSRLFPALINRKKNAGTNKMLEEKRDKLNLKEFVASKEKVFEGKKIFICSKARVGFYYYLNVYP